MARCAVVGGRAAPASRRLPPLLDDSCGCSTAPRRLRKAVLLCAACCTSLLNTVAMLAKVATAIRASEKTENEAQRSNRSRTARCSQTALFASVLHPLAVAGLTWLCFAYTPRGACHKGSWHVEGYPGTQSAHTNRFEELPSKRRNVRAAQRFEGRNPRSAKAQGHQS